MDACSKTHIGAIGPEWVEAVGIGKARGVAIGCAKHQANNLALLEWNALVLGVAQRVAREHVEGRVVPEALLDRCRSLTFACKEGLRVETALKDRLYRIAGGVDRRLVSRIEQQDRRRDDFILVELLAVEWIGGEHVREQIFGRLASALGDHLA